jgi:hypothetical protein
MCDALLGLAVSQLGMEGGRISRARPQIRNAKRPSPRNAVRRRRSPEPLRIGLRHLDGGTARRRIPTCQECTTFRFPLARFLAYYNLRAQPQGYRLNGRTSAPAPREALDRDELPPLEFTKTTQLQRRPLTPPN